MPKTTILQSATKPVAHHLHELRTSLFAVLGVFIGVSIVAYGFSGRLVQLFQRPIDQTLFYTSPIAGFSFVMKLCLMVGAIFAIPVAMNRFIAFVKPALPTSLRQNLGWYSLASIVLAVVGVTFAYSVSLPAALEFLTHFNAGADIEALITVDSYFSFVTTYLVGYALLFQTPLIMLFINRIKPLTPQQLLGSMRVVILVSFIVSAVLTPTPDPWNLLLMAVPCVLLYGIGAALVIVKNKQSKPVKATAPTPHTQTQARAPRPQPNQVNPLAGPSRSPADRIATPRPTPKTFDIVNPRPKTGQARLGAIQ